MAQIFKSKVFWIVLAVIISLTAIGATLGVLLSQNKVNTNLNQSTNADYTYTDTYGDWTYTVSGTEATITKFTGSTPDVVIPSTITKDGTTYTVTALYNASSESNSVFYGVRSTLQSITIPNTITSIGGYAFYNCTGLTSVEIPNSVTSIGEEAFRSCYGLTSVTIPNSVTSIGDWAFRNCTGLTSVTIPNSVTSIGECAFSDCTGLTSVTIPKNVTKIGGYAFNGCTGLTSVYFLRDYSGTAYGNADSNMVMYFYIRCGSAYVYSAFREGNINVTYYFINQASRDNFYNIKVSKYYSSSHITNTYRRDYWFTGNNFEVMTPQFNVEVNNSNLGSVSGNTNPAIGESTTLTATPNTGCTFKYWLKDGYQFENNTSNVLTTTFTEYLVTYTAVFEGYFTITTNVSNNEYGTVTSGGTYLNDTEITLTSTPNSGYIFVKWLKNNDEFIGNTANPLIIKVTGNDTYTAVFIPSYTITTSVNNATYGSVTAGDTYIQNTSIVLVATPNNGYRFIKWQKDGQDFENNTNTSIDVIVTEDATYTAVFEAIPQRTIAVDNLAPTVGYVTGDGTYYEGTQITLTATPNSGARFFYWLKNGQTFAGSLSNPLTITVTEDATYAVCFAPEDYNPQIRSPNSVILETEYQGVETTNPEVCGIVKTYGYGSLEGVQTVRVEAIATTGYRFVGWKINGESTVSSKYTSNNADILLSDIPNSKIIIAVFDKVA